MNAVISSEVDDPDKLVTMARDWEEMKGLELASKVTRKEAQTVPADGEYRIAVFDYGIKQSIINQLVDRGCTLGFFQLMLTLRRSGSGRPTATSSATARVIRKRPLSMRCPLLSTPNPPDVPSSASAWDIN